MKMEVLSGLLLPLFGTALGSGCVYFMKKELGIFVQKILTGFAAGVMVAASIWSLLLPALEQTESIGKSSFLPVVIGFWSGILLLTALEYLVEQMHVCCGKSGACQHKTAMMVFAVALHNLPEGMAVGVAFAGWLAQDAKMSLAGAMLLTIGIAVQNFPEGAIISMPLHAEGMKKSRAFAYGVLSGVIEPIGGLVTIFFAEFFTAILPFCLSLAAGAMFYVVIETLGQHNSDEKWQRLEPLVFSIGFTMMMILDVALKN